MDSKIEKIIDRVGKKKLKKVADRILDYIEMRNGVHRNKLHAEVKHVKDGIVIQHKYKKRLSDEDKRLADSIFNEIAREMREGL